MSVIYYHYYIADITITIAITTTAGGKLLGVWGLWFRD